MADFGRLDAEIGSLVCGTSANFNVFASCFAALSRGLAHILVVIILVSGARENGEIL